MLTMVASLSMLWGIIVEIFGVPDIFIDDVLEEKIIEIFNLCNIRVTYSDVEACHHFHIKMWCQNES